MSRQYRYGLLVSLSLLWVLPNLGALSTMSYDWDAAQYALATVEFNIAQHQPHPPGYPLWVIAVRAMAPLTHGAPLAQTILGFLFTLGAIYFLYRLANDWLGRQGARALVLLLAFSPPVQLYAFAQSTYPVDLFASSLLGWLSWRMWQGDHASLRVALPAAALLMGFRPSGVVMLGPLLAVAAVRCSRRRPAMLVLPLAVAGALLAAWFWPLARSAGGFSEWLRLNREMFGSTAGGTSVLLGAPPRLFTPIAARLTLILLVALTPLVGLLPAWRRRTSRPWGFLALWTVPGLLFVYLVHFGKPGYLLLLLPPLFLAAGVARPTWRMVAGGLLAAELIVVLPYDRLPENRVTRALALTTPQAAVAAARANRTLRDQVEKLRPSRIICSRDFKETAPNLRTVDYDFRGLSGDGEPVILTAPESTGPEAAQCLYRGKAFALWRHAAAQQPDPR